MMKKKIKRNVTKKKKEFRFHKVSVIDKRGKMISVRHPAYVFLEKGNVYIYVTITHSDRIKDVVLIELKKNPNPKDKRKSFWVATIKQDTKDTFGKRQKGWKLDPIDDEEIRKKHKKR